MLARAVARPATPSYPRVSSQLHAMLEAVVTGRLAPARAARRVTEAISAITGLPVLRDGDAATRAAGDTSAVVTPAETATITWP